MPIIDPFLSFDQTPYQTAPQLPLQTLVVLAKALDTRMPQTSPQHVIEAADDMRATAKEAGKAMVVRLRETNQISLAADLLLDNAMDGLFTLIRDDLRGYRAYQRPGLDFLLQDPDWQVRLEELREDAKKAEDLSVKLFGDGNLDMLKREFPEQSQAMTNILNLVDEDQLEGGLIDLTGPDLFPLIRRVNDEYSKMVDRRTTADNASKADLKTARHKLQRRIVSYCSLVLTMLKEDKPETLGIVQTALRPMVTMRVLRTAGETTQPTDPQDADISIDPEANLAKVLAEAQADLDQEG